MRTTRLDELNNTYYAFSLMDSCTYAKVQLCLSATPATAHCAIHEIELADQSHERAAHAETAKDSKPPCRENRERRTNIFQLLHMDML